MSCYTNICKSCNIHRLKYLILEYRYQRIDILESLNILCCIK